VGVSRGAGSGAGLGSGLGLGLDLDWRLGWSSGFGFGMLRDGPEGDLCAVEELCAHVRLDCAEEDSIADAGDEVADVLIAGERGQGQAEGCIRAAVGVADGAGLVQGRAENRCPDPGAPADDGVLKGRAEFFFPARGESGFDGFDQDVLREGEVWPLRINCAPWEVNYLQPFAVGRAALARHSAAYMMIDVLVGGL
jgi:hypothetical protein